MGYPLYTLKEYIRYRLTAKNAHGIHSPFVFDLYNQVIKRKDSSRSKSLLKLRKMFLSDKRKLIYRDPRSGKQIKTTIQSLARKVSSSPQFSLFLIHLTEWLGARSVLETGTSIGLNALSLSHSSTLKKVITIEGSEEIARIASEYLEIHSKEIHVIKGDVFDVFEGQLAAGKPEFIFLDADHREKTIRFYLDAIHRMKKQPLCIAIHDIHWSLEMRKAWEAVIFDPAYRLTIDIFDAGLIFPYFSGEKQHFVLKF